MTDARCPICDQVHEEFPYECWRKALEETFQGKSVESFEEYINTFSVRKRRPTKRKRPEKLRGITQLIKTGCGNLYATVCLDENNEIFECFSHLGKSGGCQAAQGEAITRLISLSLRYNVPVEDIIDELKFIKCPSPTWWQGEQVQSCADALAKVLKGCKDEL